MKLVYGIITCCRPEYFECNIKTLIETMDTKHDWHIIIGDDSSDSDYSSSYVKVLRELGHKVTIIRSNRRGPHYLVNKILRTASEEKFDYGFMVEDDIFFIQKEWDNLYIKSMQLSSFDYLCYFNSKWARQYHRGPCILSITKILDKQLQSEIRIFSCFGCFWTFSPKVIKNVGYFDMHNLGVWGNGHTDYSIRCCRAGLNGMNGRLFDMLNSQEYIEMQSDGYVSSYNECKFDSGLIGVPNGKHKSETMCKVKRVFIPYNELNLNMFGQVVE